MSSWQSAVATSAEARMCWPQLGQLKRNSFVRLSASHEHTGPLFAARQRRNRLAKLASLADVEGHPPAAIAQTARPLPFARSQWTTLAVPTARRAAARAQLPHPTPARVPEFFVRDVRRRGPGPAPPTVPEAKTGVGCRTARGSRRHRTLPGQEQAAVEECLWGPTAADKLSSKGLSLQKVNAIFMAGSR